MFCAILLDVHVIYSRFCNVSGFLSAIDKSFVIDALLLPIICCKYCFNDDHFWTQLTASCEKLPIYKQMIPPFGFLSAFVGDMTGQMQRLRFERPC